MRHTSAWPSSPVDPEELIIVHLVSLHPCAVVEKLLQSSEPYDKHKRADVGNQKPDLQPGEELCNAKHQEVEVEEKFELVDENQGQKGQHVVLPIVQFVVVLKIG